MNVQSKLMEYLRRNNVTEFLPINDGALINPNTFVIGGVNTEGAILFADLPGYSTMCSKRTPPECSYFANSFFSWFEAEAIRNYGGIIDKFIGDEIMVLYPKSESKTSPLEAAMRSAELMIRYDPYSFKPKIGIASGPFIVAAVGTKDNWSISAIGNIVNLASRCVSEAGSPGVIGIASDDTNLVNEVFTDENQWKVLESTTFEPKNMERSPIIKVERSAEWIPGFDRFEDIKANIQIAIERGVIQNDV